LEIANNRMMPYLNEKQRRLFVAIEAKVIGHDGITQVSTLSGISRVTLTKGTKEINQFQPNKNT